MERVQYLLDKRIIREITPIFDTRALGYSSMLVAAKVDADEPAPRGAVHQLAPGRHAQLPAQPRLQPLVHARGRARLQARPGRHARRDRGQDRRRVDPPAADAEAVQDPHGPRDGGRHRRAHDGRRGRRADGARPDRALAKRTSTSSRPPRARWRCAREPTSRPPSGSASGRRGPAPARVAARARRAAPRGRDPLPPPRRLLGQRHGRLGRAGGRDPRHRPADGRLPRHLALLPAPDLRGLAVLRLHDGPRALEGGVRRGAGRDRRVDRHRRARDAVLEHRVQEGPDALLHRRLQALGRGARRV